MRSLGVKKHFITFVTLISELLTDHQPREFSFLVFSCLVSFMPTLMTNKGFKIVMTGQFFTLAIFHCWSLESNPGTNPDPEELEAMVDVS